MNVKEQVLNQLEKNKGEYISGGSLSEELGVSRNAIWKAIQSLIKDGYLIESKSRKGYLLQEESDILSTQSISKYLKNNLDHVMKIMSKKLKIFLNYLNNQYFFLVKFHY